MTDRQFELRRWILFSLLAVLVVWLAPCYVHGETFRVATWNVHGFRDDPAARAVIVARVDADLWLTQEGVFTDVPSIGSGRHATVAGIDFWSVHLAAGYNRPLRLRQLEAVLALLDTSRPTIVGGDFNDVGGDPSSPIALMVDAGFDVIDARHPLTGSRATYHAAYPTARFDYIAVTSHFADRVLAAGIDGDLAASDHLAVWVDLDWPPVPEPVGFSLWMGAIGVCLLLGRMRPKSAHVARSR